jgi:glycerol uptake facilitator-like aquaporin
MVHLLGMKVAAEFLGTFILAASIEFMTSYDQDNQTNLLLAILAGFFVAITLTREISGGHINPGVTLTCYLAEQNSKEKNEQANTMWTYICAQLAGAASAALLGLIAYNDNIFKLAPAPKTFASEAFVLEVLGSALFYTIILVQGDKDAKLCNDKSISTLVITAGLASGIALAGNVSAACLNPALGFGFNFGRLLITGKLEECKYLWVYIIGPACGSFLASFFYVNVFRRYWEIEQEEKREYRLMESEMRD